MLDVKEPRVTRSPKAVGRNRQADRRSSSSNSQSGTRTAHPGAAANYHFAAPPVTDRSTMRGAAPGRLSDLQSRPAPARRPELDRAAAPLHAKPSTKAKPARRVVIDRLAQQEARLFGVVVVCVGLVCGLLIFYLCAYANVSRLGMQLAKNRVELKQKQLLGETLHAYVAREASPSRISTAAVKQGMVLEHTQQICYIDPSTLPADTTVLASDKPDNIVNPVDPQAGRRVASNGANTDPKPTAAVTN